MDLLLLGSLALFGGLLSLTGLFDHHSDDEPEPHGTSGDDTLSGTTGILHGWGGDDLMDAGKDAQAYGGLGDDTLTASGAAFANGGAGDDDLTGTENATLQGNNGDDRLTLDGESRGYGGSGSDILTVSDFAIGNGDGGADVMYGSGNATISGGAGSDLLHLAESSHANGGEGDDTVIGHLSGDDTLGDITLGKGHDTVVADISGLGQDDNTTMTITDFDPRNDHLGLIMSAEDLAQSAITTLTDTLAGFTDVQIYRPLLDQTITLHLEGVTSFSPDQLSIYATEQDAIDGTPSGDGGHGTLTFGTSGNDVMSNPPEYGTDGRLYGFEGDDTLNAALFAYGGAGDDVVVSFAEGYGGDGNDIVQINSGGEGYDAIARGGDGDDTIYGGNPGQNNAYYGGPGDDAMLIYDSQGIIHGGGGNDLIMDYATDDNHHIVTLGNGADTYAIDGWHPRGSGMPESLITITDFDPAQDELAVFQSQGGTNPPSVSVASNLAGGYTEVTLTYANVGQGDEPLVIRLDGITAFDPTSIVYYDSPVAIFDARI